MAPLHLERLGCHGRSGHRTKLRGHYVGDCAFRRPVVDCPRLHGQGDGSCQLLIPQGSDKFDNVLVGGQRDY
jgi:hypothetical protein